ncbi:NUDIX domain-containing protein [Actinomycetes bacterium NPDC127524]
MESEQLKIFDERGRHIGKASRSDVHKNGYWHETFHCWFISKKGDQEYIYFQQRSSGKKDFPDLLDITAAGHLTSEESVQDGVREIREELGIPVSFTDLVSIGIIKDQLQNKGFNDNELSHVYLYDITGLDISFHFQKEEVSGMFRVASADFYKMFLENGQEIPVNGYYINQQGEEIKVDGHAIKSSFVPHGKEYYHRVSGALKKYFSSLN